MEILDYEQWECYVKERVVQNKRGVDTLSPNVAVATQEKQLQQETLCEGIDLIRVEVRGRLGLKQGGKIFQGNELNKTNPFGELKTQTFL